MTRESLREHLCMYRWARLILARPWLVVLCTLLVLAGCLYAAGTRLSMNTNTADLVSPDAPFQQYRRYLERLFPQDINTVLVVLESDTPEVTANAAKRLVKLLRADTRHFQSVYLPDEGEFFERNGLLYLDYDDLEELGAQLSEAQPFMGRLALDNSLGGLFGILSQALTMGDDDLPLELGPFLERIEGTLQGVREGRRVQLSWQKLMLEDPRNLLTPKRRFLVVRPRFDYTQFLPAKAAIDAIHAYGAQIQDPRLPEVKVSLTGEAALEHDELAGVSQGALAGALFSLGMVLLVLWVAFRSVWMMLASILTLLVGMGLAGGFAALAIGELNLISIAFAVSNIGLGVEYGIHFCLRFKDYLAANVSRNRALLATISTIGPSLVLVAVTTAIGLYAFIPTDYKGISELGLLAGTSLFLSLIATLTLLPAMLRMLPARSHKAHPPAALQRISTFLGTLPLRYAVHIKYLTLVMALGALYLLCGVRVDFNPVNLRDPNSESVRTFRKLLESPGTSPMSLTVLTQGEAETFAVQRRLETRPTVHETVSLLDFVPDDQDAKLALLEELALVLGPQLEGFPDLMPQHDAEAALRDFHATLERALEGRWDDKDRKAILALRDEIGQLLQTLKSLPPQDREALLEQLQISILGALPGTIRNLEAGLNATEINREALPADFRERWLSPVDDVYRIQVRPRKDLNDLAELREFIEDVQQVAPDATDAPVLYLESMKEVVRAFQQAFSIALVVIMALLLVVRRNLKDTLLVLFPLLLTGLFAMAATVLMGVQLNFANIIALPLLLGLGVDNGIHMVERLRRSASVEQNIYESSTARGILYGSITQIVGFLGLVFSPHQGVSSLGLIIAIGIFFIMWCTFVVLPAFSRLALRREVAALQDQRA